jgi:hypothetical protein
MKHQHDNSESDGVWYRRADSLHLHLSAGQIRPNSSLVESSRVLQLSLDSEMGCHTYVLSTDVEVEGGTGRFHGGYFVSTGPVQILNHDIPLQHASTGILWFLRGE